MNRAHSAILCGALYLAVVFHAAPAYAVGPAALAEDLAALVAEGRGVLMPNLDESQVEYRGVQMLSDDFPASFLAGLVPATEYGVTVYPIAIRIDDATGNAVFFNAAETPFYTVPRIAPANWMALLHPLLATNPWFAESRVIAQWTLVPAASLDDYLAAANASPSLPLRSASTPSGGLEITNLMFTAITVSESNVVLEVAWPTNDIPDGEPLDLYFSPELATNVWTLLDTAFPANATNFTFTVDGADLPGFINEIPPHVHDASCVPITNIIQSVFLPGEVETNIVFSCQTNPPAPPVAGFFRAGTRHDTDGDGLPDAYEMLVAGTDPEDADTDGDGIHDGVDLAPSTAYVAQSGPCRSGNLAWFEVCEDMWYPYHDFFHVPSGLVLDLSRTYAINRSAGWQQYWLADGPSLAYPPCLMNEFLAWGDSEGAGGVLVNETLVNPPRFLPVSTNSPALLFLGVGSSSSGFYENSAVYLVAWAPGISYTGLPSCPVGTTNVFHAVGATPPAINVAISLAGIPSGREVDAQVAVTNNLVAISGLDFDLSSGGLGGTLTPRSPGLFPLPSAEPIPAEPFSGFTNALLHLSPSLTYGTGHGGGRGELDYSGGLYRKVSSFPLDSATLRRGFLRDATGASLCDCQPDLRLGTDDPAVLSVVTTNVTVSGDTATATVSLGGTVLWTGTATHPAYATGEDETLLSGGSDAGSCGCGDLRETEGDALRSFAFRLPLGFPRTGQVSGLLWFELDSMAPLSPASFQILARADAGISDTTAGGVRTVVCSDECGRTVSISQSEGVLSAVVTKTATGEHEHTWEFTQGGGTCRVRKLSRLGNVMRDVTYACADGVWSRSNAIGQTEEELAVTDDLNGPTGVYREERTLTDASGATLSHTITESRRYGAYDRAVLRETLHLEASHSGLWKTNSATYWEDFDHPLRNGRPRLLSGNARAWRYTAYDDDGRETLRIDQLDGSPAPDDGAYSASGLPQDTSFMLTVSDYMALAGDTTAAADRATPRTVSRFAVYEGQSPILVSRTWRVCSRGMVDGMPALTVRTERAHSQNAVFGDPGNAVSETSLFDEDAPGVPLLLRGRPVSETGEDGVTTRYVYEYGVWDSASRTFTAGSAGGLPASSHLRALSYRTTAAAPCGVPYVSTGTLSIEDAVHGNLLFEANLVQTNAPVPGLPDSSTLGLSDFALLDWSGNTYDDQNRLRHMLHSDGSWSTNAYSCCRLLWTQDREGYRVERLADTTTTSFHWAELHPSLCELPGYLPTYQYHHLLPSPYLYAFTNDFLAVEHRLDPLGRETMRRKLSTRPGRCASVDSVLPANGYAWQSAETNEYPSGVSGHVRHTDARGLVTETIQTGTQGESVTQADELDGTNLLARTVTMSIRGGGSVTRREWDTQWTENRHFALYAADGTRQTYSVTETSDGVSRTNCVTRYDFLGRAAVEETPLSCITYTYDGPSYRVLSETDSVSGIAAAHAYDELGERIATASGGVSDVSATSYAEISNAIWRVVTSFRTDGAMTNNLIVVRERLTGLSNGLRACRETVSGGVLERTTTTYDPATKISTETTLRDSLAPCIVKRMFGRIIEETDSSGVTWKHQRDPYGRTYVEWEENEFGTFGRRYLGRNGIGDVEEEVETSQIRWQGGISGFSALHQYNIRGNRTYHINPLNEETVFAYDAAGRLTAVDGATYPMLFAYDALGRRTAIATTRDGSTADVTSWMYDPLTDLCLAKIYADDAFVLYAYTADGLPLWTIWAREEWRQNAYDAKRRLVGIAYSDTTPSVAYAYDAFGRMTNATLSTGRVADCEYDSDDNIVSETVAAPDAAATTLRRFRDAANRDGGYSLLVDGMTNAVVSYEWGMDGHLACFATADGLEVAYTNAAGRLAGYTVSRNGVEVFRRVQARNLQLPSRIVAVTNMAAGVAVSHFDYAHDDLHRPVSRNGDTFSYNFRGEVAVAAIAGATSSYAYDPIGNRTQSIDNFGNRTYTHNALNEMLSDSRMPRTYDADGNLVFDWRFDYAWDAENRLVSATPVFLADDARRVRNEYDHLSRRVTKHIDVWNAAAETWTPAKTHSFVYDGWNPILETVVDHAAGTTNAVRYLWGLDLSGTLQGAGGVGGLLAVVRNGSTYFPCYDANGNVTEYVSESGTAVAAYVYDAFGNALSATGPMADAFPHRFSTKYFDAETGLYYYGYRFYSPEMGRWMNRDPLNEFHALNLFCFSDNHPSTSFDLLGLVDLNPASAYDQFFQSFLKNCLGECFIDHYYLAIAAIGGQAGGDPWFYNFLCWYFFGNGTEAVVLSATHVSQMKTYPVLFSVKSEENPIPNRVIREKKSKRGFGVSEVGPGNSTIGQFHVYYRGEICNGRFTGEYRIDDRFDFDWKPWIKGGRSILGELTLRIFTLTANGMPFDVRSEWIPLVEDLQPQSDVNLEQ